MSIPAAALPLLLRAGLRYLLRHPWQLGLSLLGVALGVAVVVAVELANQSAARAFDLSSEALTGHATHQVLPGPGGLDVDWYVRLRRDHGVRAAAPVVEGHAESVIEAGRSLRILGVDPLAESGIRPGLEGLDQGPGLGELMGRGDGALLLAEDMRRLGLEPGETLPLRLHGEERGLRLLGTLEPARPLDAQGLRDVVVMDIAAAQELLGREGRLDRVDLILPDDAAGERVRELLPADAQLVTADARRASMAEMTRAFRLNLTAFSLLALVVGGFLIYNTMTFSVVQRRELLGMLRAVGVGRRQVFALVLAEALVIGLLGTLAGLLLGTAIAHVLLDLVSRTINDLYFLLSVRELNLAPVSLLLAVALGLGMTVAAALTPAWEATTTPPRAVLSRSDLEAGIRRRQPWLLAGGLATLVLGGAALGFAGGGLYPAFAGLFLLIMGSALLVPPGMAWLMRRFASLPAGGGVSGRMAARGVVAGLSRTGVAAAALMVAVSAVIGVGVMVDSFRGTFVDWLDATLRADLYVSVPDGGSLAPEAVRALRDLDGLAASSTALYTRVTAGGERHRLRVFDLDAPLLDNFAYLAGDPRQVRARFRPEDVVLVTEPFAHHQEVGVGDALVLATADGERPFRVVAVIRDYTTSEGAVVMSRAVFDRHWQDPTVNSVGLYAGDDVGGDGLEAAARAVVAGHQGVRFRSDQELRALSLQVFDQTFTITRVLQWLAMLVAVVGVLSALTALALERQREYAVLRAIGVSPGQLWGLVSLQNGLLGLVAGLFALPLGLVLAAALTLVINQRSFGWSMDVHVAPGILLQAVGLALVAAVVAGLYPAWRMARTPPARALRED